jgi:hypothetical protein
VPARDAPVSGNTFVDLSGRARLPEASTTSLRSSRTTACRAIVLGTSVVTVTVGADLVGRGLAKLIYSVEGNSLTLNAAPPPRAGP